VSGRADGDVEPAEAVVFLLCLKQAGKAALAGSVEFAGGYAWAQRGYGLVCIFYGEYRCTPHMFPKHDRQFTKDQ